jgi:hypothetical protein
LGYDGIYNLGYREPLHVRFKDVRIFKNGQGSRGLKKQIGIAPHEIPLLALNPAFGGDCTSDNKGEVVCNAFSFARWGEIVSMQYGVRIAVLFD